MKTSYLKKWLQEIPELRTYLSNEDKQILDTIDPLKYVNHNLTRPEEIVRIIDDHKPQAWKWERMFPGLKNLSAEDRIILDHIVPTDYLTSITEEDIRRIITYRKNNIRMSAEEEASRKAKVYYETHKEEIQKEEKKRDNIAQHFKWSLIGGTAMLTLGCALHTPILPIIGSGLIALFAFSGAETLKNLDSRSVLPKNRNTGDRLDFLSASFVVIYFITLIGIGMLLGSLLAWIIAGWDVSQSLIYISVAIIVIPFLLFLLIASVAPSKE